MKRQISNGIHLSTLEEGMIVSCDRGKDGWMGKCIGVLRSQAADWSDGEKIWVITDEYEGTNLWGIADPYSGFLDDHRNLTIIERPKKEVKDESIVGFTYESA